MNVIRSIGHYLIVWYANNFAAPFWVVGHYHILVNDLEQAEQLASIMIVNLVTALGIYLDWRIQHREKHIAPEVLPQQLKFFVIAKEKTPQQVNSYIESGMKSRNLSLEDIVHIREDETWIYVHYKTRHE